MSNFWPSVLSFWGRHGEPWWSSCSSFLLSLVQLAVHLWLHRWCVPLHHGRCLSGLLSKTPLWIGINNCMGTSLLSNLPICNMYVMIPSFSCPSIWNPIHYSFIIIVKNFVWHVPIYSWIGIKLNTCIGLVNTYHVHIRSKSVLELLCAYLWKSTFQACTCTRAPKESKFLNCVF